VHTIPHRRPALLALAILLGAVFLARPAAGDDRLLGPWASRNLSPVYASLGVPVMDDARAPGAGRHVGRWQIHGASHSVLERAGAGALELDGETWRQDLNLRLGLGAKLSLGVNLPWVSHTGGRLDSLIDGWHASWGLPDGARPQQEQDVLRFAYQFEAQEFLLERSASGWGDAELSLAWHFAPGERTAAAVFANAKLNTGSLRNFTGSGDMAFAAGVRTSTTACLIERLTCHLQLGLLRPGAIAYAPTAASQTWFSGLSLVWRLTDSLSLVSQLDAQGVVFEDGPLAVNGDPIWGTLGLRWAPGGRWTLEAAFSEDLAVGAAPDITFLAGVARAF